MDNSRNGRAVVDGSPVPGCKFYTTGTHTIPAGSRWVMSGFGVIGAVAATVTFTDMFSNTHTSKSFPVGYVSPVYMTSITVAAGEVQVFFAENVAMVDT